MKPIVLFYVQHLLGIGHLRRAALIARALLAAGVDLRLVSGGMPAGEVDLGGAALVQLPPAAAADMHFSAILDEHGRPIDDAWRARRRQQLLLAFAAARPELVLIELYPFGRRQFAFELRPLMEAARVRGLPLAVSLRDILVAKSKPDRVAETVALVRSHVDRVLVHGDPRLIRLDTTFPAAAEIADRLTYTGYVAEAVVPAAPEGTEILVSAGGGAVGGPLLAATLAARPATRAAKAPWRLIAGPNLPAGEFAALQRAARMASSGVTVERFRADFPALLAQSRLSISQAGYNTVMDILATGARALVLPFAEGAESEQTVRARLLAERGLLGVVEPGAVPGDGPEPAKLAAAIDAALDRPRPGPGAVDLGGAAETARQILGMLR